VTVCQDQPEVVAKGFAKEWSSVILFNVDGTAFSAKTK